MKKPKRDLEPIIAYSGTLILIVYLLISYDTFFADEKLPPHGKWIVVVYKFLLNDSVGRIIGKVGLLLLGIYSFQRLYVSFKIKK
ncbi:hypothetical protein [Arenibacter palladensis]|uniref:hypothetical protein n=1 Tax=Arenibacter palladensis TaxID=237373 RepID=UPI0026E3AB19|nr:hypothetical protein [Arenibacter palladensis]MDO6601331.1 hypothetical protein [Arenibacter palladensis]